ncbi:MAG: dipeptide ABC transporter ATP-binding protein [Geminicoccaceae bacterium]
MTALASIADLGLAYGGTQVLDGVTLDIAPGEILGLVGESGCGKSTLAYLLLGWKQPSARILAGNVRLDGDDLLRLDRKSLDMLRGARVALVPQNPTTALDPAMRVGEQVAEELRRHRSVPADRIDARVADLFRDVGLPAPTTIGRRWPHQLSGGQQQRVAIAMALACNPALLVLDEPTTGLDVTTQQQIVSLLADLRARHRTAMLYVTHDLALLAEIADRIGVMYAGRLVEIGLTAELFARPAHPYTRGLIATIPGHDAGGEALTGMLRREALPPGCPFAPRCPYAEPACLAERQIQQPVRPGHAVACRRWRDLPPVQRRSSRTIASRGSTSAPLLDVRGLDLSYVKPSLLDSVRRLSPPPPVVAGLDLTISKGEVVALVGESGSGKSTAARAIAGLLPPLRGTLSFAGAALPGDLRHRTADQRRRIQYVFQNPDASLNPRLTIGEALSRARRFFFPSDDGTARRLVDALAAVRLDAAFAARYPDELSGGERQRVAIARALVVEPDLVLCDEILSALDVSVQASVLDLLETLRAKTGVAMLFISHDLAVVREIADRVAVLYRGRLMETGPTASLFSPPFHPYTFTLLMAQPALHLGARVRLPAGAGAATPDPDQGCPFAGRCPWQIQGSVCMSTVPPWRELGGGHRLRCHLEPDDLARRAVAAMPPVREGVPA